MRYHDVVRVILASEYGGPEVKVREFSIRRIEENKFMSAELGLAQEVTISHTLVEALAKIALEIER